MLQADTRIEVNVLFPVVQKGKFQCPETDMTQANGYKKPDPEVS
jgi:hypothetical protein